MRMTHTLPLLAVLALPALALGAGPFASELDGEGGPPPWMETRHERMAEFLDLSEEQAVQWRALHEERMTAMRGRFEVVGDLREQVRSMLESESPDAEAVGRSVIAAHREMEALRASGEDLHASLAEILTPDQRQRLETLREAREELGPGRGRPSHGSFGRHGGRRHGPHAGLDEDDS